jgi:hypothetical protein
MSISLGFYDLFAYLIPGVFYLFVFNEFLAIFGFAHIEPQDLNTLPAAIIVGIVGYALTQALDFIAIRWRTLFQPKDSKLEAVEKLKKDFPGYKINFLPQDLRLLHSLIRRNHLEAATTIDLNRALGIMLQNISLALLLFMFSQGISFFIQGYDWEHLLLAIFSLIVSLLIRRKSQLYNLWFYNHIYEIALTYGNDTSKIIKKVQALKSIDENARK